MRFDLSRGKGEKNGLEFPRAHVFEVRGVFKHVRGTNAGCLNVLTSLYFTNEVINILSFNYKSCIRYSCTLLSNTNIVFAPLLGHVTSY